MLFDFLNSTVLSVFPVLNAVRRLYSAGTMSDLVPSAAEQLKELQHLLDVDTNLSLGDTLQLPDFDGQLVEMYRPAIAGASRLTANAGHATTAVAFLEVLRESVESLSESQQTRSARARCLRAGRQVFVSLVNAIHEHLGDPHSSCKQQRNMLEDTILGIDGLVAFSTSRTQMAKIFCSVPGKKKTKKSGSFIHDLLAMCNQNLESALLTVRAVEAMSKLSAIPGAVSYTHLTLPTIYSV